MFCLNAIVSVIALLVCFQTVLQFSVFASSQNVNTALTLRLERQPPAQHATERDKWEQEKAYFWEILHAIVWDVALLLLFILQHRIMASNWWKNLLSDLGINTAQRAIYVLATCWTLQYMTWSLAPVRGSPLWYFDTSLDRLSWLLFAVLHLIAWGLLYGTCLVMDMPEMVGLKQVYYQYLGVEPPLAHKSGPTKRLYGRMRHGGASCLLLVFWVHPMMTVTRIVMATMLTAFTLCGFAVHEADYVYLREQLARKRITLRMQRTKTIDLLQ